jgi:hypothetical protein
MATIPTPEPPTPPGPEPQPVPPHDPVPAPPVPPPDTPKIAFLAETSAFPKDQSEVADYLATLLKNHDEEPEAIKAGVRFAVLSLRRLKRCELIPR